MPTTDTDVVLEPEQPKSGLTTTEFWTSIGAVLGNFLFGLVLMGRMTAEDAQALSGAVSALFTTVPVVIANALIIWKYVSSRAAVKSNAATENTRRLEVRENIRADFKLKVLAMQAGTDPAR